MGLSLFQKLLKNIINIKGVYKMKDAVVDENEFIERMTKKYRQRRELVILLIKMCKDNDIREHKKNIEKL